MLLFVCLGSPFIIWFHKYAQSAVASQSYWLSLVHLANVWKAKPFCNWGELYTKNKLNRNGKKKKKQIDYMLLLFKFIMLHFGIRVHCLIQSMTCNKNQSDIAAV